MNRETVTAAEKAREHLDYAELQMDNPSVYPGGVQVHATMAAAYASLAVVEELARFEAVAVEERKP